jgi:hypothetical protein
MEDMIFMYLRSVGVSWSDPENLGPSINTAENEVFPFYHENGRLYFSSRGHNTIGNLDIFYSEKTKWKLDNTH